MAKIVRRRRNSYFISLLISNVELVVKILSPRKDFLKHFFSKNGTV